MTSNCLSEVLSYKTLLLHQELDDFSEAETSTLNLFLVCHTRRVQF
jgi:hypothetical protein